MNFIKYITPVNLANEKSKFFSSNIYNPQLEYNWNEPQSAKWVNTHPELREIIAILHAQDKDQIRIVFSKLFDTQITSELLNLSRNIVSNKPYIIPSEPITKVIKSFEQAFEFLGLEDYSIEIVDQYGFNFRPSAEDKKILVSKYLNLDFFSIDGEVKHELLHVIRHVNGKYNSIPKHPKYLPTEEGFATYCQDYAGENGRSSLFQHAAEYAMTEIALNGSLREVTDYLESIGFSQELAWQRAIRHKFGFIDTSKPGDIMKPSMYFYHEQQIKILTIEEKYRLFVGKITKEQLKEYPEYIGLIPLSKLQEFYNWNESI